MNKLKIIFFGSPYYSVPLLEKTIELGHEVSLVVSQGTTKTRRGKIIKTSVHQYCEDKNINCLLPTHFTDSINKEIMSLKYDLGIIYAYGKLVPKDIIEHSKFGIMNLHCSLLPSYRGAAPIQHALINGEDYTGYTYFRINELLDEGDIILQEKYKILQSDNCLSIQDSLTALAVSNLSVAISKIVDGKFLDGNHQERISYANKIQKKDSVFDWDRDVVSICNRIRALSTWPIARANLLGEDIKIIEAHYVQQDHDITFGKVKAFSKDELLVTAKGGYISINKLQLEGKKIITNRDLFNSNSEFKDKLLNNLVQN